MDVPPGELKQRKDHLKKLKEDFEESVECMRKRAVELKRTQQRRQSYKAIKADTARKAERQRPTSAVVDSTGEHAFESVSTRAPVGCWPEPVLSPFIQRTGVSVTDLAPAPAMSLALLHEMRTSQLLKDALVSSVLRSLVPVQPVPSPQASDQAILGRLLLGARKRAHFGS